MSEQQYFSMLTETVDEVRRRITSDGNAPADYDAVCALDHAHLGYGEVRRGDFALDYYKGKKTKKFFHAVITRLDTGRYELVTYVL
jgi:hypothetical protein